jgi:GMP synthase-like glutamine amidotransferase
VADNPRALVIENDPTDDVRLLGEWLTEAGLDLEVLRPHAGESLPADLDGYAALVVLGGDQHAYPGPDGQPGAPWFRDLESILRKAVRASLPTLGICLGAQLLASAHNGTVAAAAAGPEIGPRLVAKRDAAERDPLFAPLPMLPDVIQWHHDEIVELPLGAVLLATSTNYANQAFRLGDSAWGVQFHPEADTAMIAQWAGTNGPVLAALGTTADEVVAAVDALMDDLFEVWQPVAARFAALTLGELSRGKPERQGFDLQAPGGPSGSNPRRPPGPAIGRELPLLGH